MDSHIESALKTKVLYCTHCEVPVQAIMLLIFGNDTPIIELLRILGLEPHREFDPTMT